MHVHHVTSLYVGHDILKEIKERIFIRLSKSCHDDEGISICRTIDVNKKASGEGYSIYYYNKESDGEDDSICHRD